MKQKSALLVALVLGGCPSTQSTAPTSVTGTAEPKQLPAPTVSSAEPSRPSDGAGPPSGTSAGRQWTFDTDRADAPPSGFSFGKTGSGKPGHWMVRPASDAPSAPN